jgi:hypothetical protein
MSRADLTVILIVLACSCTKVTDPEEEFLGTWELRKTTGFSTMNFPAGNGNRCVFGRDSLYYYFDFRLQQTFSWEVRRELFSASGIPGRAYRLFTGLPAQDERLIQISGDTLLFYPPENMLEAVTSMYVRTKD